MVGVVVALWLSVVLVAVVVAVVVVAAAAKATPPLPPPHHTRLMVFPQAHWHPATHCPSSVVP